MAFNRGFFDWFGTVPRLAVAGGIVIITVALSVLLGNITYGLTRSMELQVAAIGAVILVMAFLSYRIFNDV